MNPQIEALIDKAYGKMCTGRHTENMETMKAFARAVAEIVSAEMVKYTSDECNKMHPYPRAGYLERCVEEQETREELLKSFDE